MCLYQARTRNPTLCRVLFIFVVYYIILDNEKNIFGEKKIDNIYMSLCMIAWIVTRKRGDGKYYFDLRQTNNNTANKLLL
jgi:hypothetical protein